MGMDVWEEKTKRNEKSGVKGTARLSVCKKGGISEILVKDGGWLCRATKEGGVECNCGWMAAREMKESSRVE